MQAVLVEGDGIGPEVTRAARRVIEACGVPVSWEVHQAGADALARTGELVPRETLEAMRRVRFALKGPFRTPSGGTQRSANWILRRELDLYACLRPIRRRSRGIDFLIVRENVEDLYAAIEWMAAPGVAHAVKVATHDGCTRIARWAFALARARGRRRVTIVHKANNLKLTDGMFLDVARAVGAEYPDLVCDDMLADTAAAAIVGAPKTLDVMLMPNTFGDILSSAGAPLAGGIGVVPAMNAGGGLAVAEALHGSADDLAGTGRANPLGMIGAAAMLLAAAGYPREAAAIDSAIERAIDDPPAAATETITEWIVESVGAQLVAA
jgi:isocitrate dehydrogenase (NAD+)